MPLFNFDTAIATVKDAHTEYTRIKGEIDKNKTELSMLNIEKKTMEDNLNRLKTCGDFEKFNEAQTLKKSNQVQLDNLRVEKEAIQAQIRELPQITSSIEEREQYATQLEVHANIEALAGGLESLKPHLADLHLAYTDHHHEHQQFSVINAYNCMLEIVKFEIVLQGYQNDNMPVELNEKLGELHKFLDEESPVAKLLKNSCKIGDFDARINQNTVLEQKDNIFKEHALVQEVETLLSVSITGLEVTISKNESDEERNLPERKEELNCKVRKIQTDIDNYYNKQADQDVIIGLFNALPIEKPITEINFQDYGKKLKDQIEANEAGIVSFQVKQKNLFTEYDAAKTNLDDAVQALQKQYKQCALSLAALTTCAAVACVAFEVLSLFVVVPVLLVSLAAIGLWQYSQPTDPEVISNNCHTI